jgi:putative ABC transport system substrate-binding protein
VAGFRRGLAEAGYVPDKNVAIEVRLADDAGGLPRLATELVERKVDLIVTAGSPYAALAAKNAAPTIPIVFSISDDPVNMALSPASVGPAAMLRGCLSLPVNLAASG